MKNQNETIQIKDAAYLDIDAIIAICEEKLVVKNQEKFTKDDFAKKGFLYSKITFADAKEMIDDKKNYLCLVSKKGDEVIGYLTACDITKTEIEFQKEVAEFDEIKKSNGKIFYYKQIAKKSGEKNVGEKLLLAMLDEAKARGYLRIVCKIIHEPFYNQVSTSFHEKYGFRKIGVIKEDGKYGKLLIGVYLKNL